MGQHGPGGPGGPGGPMGMPEADTSAIRDYCARMEGDEIVAYCTGCNAGLQQSTDKRVFGFVELAFPPSWW